MSRIVGKYKVVMDICPQCEAYMSIQKTVIKEETLGVEHLAWRSRCLDCGADFATVGQMDRTLKSYYEEKGK